MHTFEGYQKFNKEVNQSSKCVLSIWYLQQDNIALETSLEKCKSYVSTFQKE